MFLLRAIGRLRRPIQSACFLLFLALFFSVCWPYDVRHHAEARAAREMVEAEAFLALDPLVSVSTAIAARAWVWSLAWAAALLAVCLVIPRGFCAYVCPFGTLLDLFHVALSSLRSAWGRLFGRSAALRARDAERRQTRSHAERRDEKVGEARRRGWWVHLRYYVLGGLLAAAACGVLLSGFVAAIPVFTRGMMYLAAPVQLGLAKGWYLIPPMHAGHYLSIGLFVLTIALGLLAARFWCRYLCPSGAVFSVANVLRLTERKVTPACIQCGKCARACSFDAIRPDFTTRALDCTFCQTCGKVCPVNAIEFGWRRLARRTSGASDGPVSRRGFAMGLGAGLAAAVGIRQLRGAPPDHPPLRPPGSVPEPDFLRLCVRCGQCLKACPFNVLQPMGFEHGLESLWTPQVVPDWVGCEPKCNNCGQVCPTGAIRALPLDEKRAARIGLAIVNEATCLPHLGTEACQMCFDECKAAGYDAIEFVRVHVEIGDDGQPVEGSGFSAPVVLADKCNGCGLCQSRCYHINAKQKHLMAESSIVVIAGPGNEDRLTRGSYRALREAERRQREEQRKKLQPKDSGDSYLPDFLK
ncbi:MAG TPA: 4Fe-4S binding protein [Planctomycetota bacterium]|nr:4Fe-4S binding protein [Planctomycetota bacterium]HRR80094.1 4Fe-4S binding protein [Planctomycetota bacterium]HRT93780.1 4Fe-4S binding protein [Planctomycetota bacterium]